MTHKKKKTRWTHMLGNDEYPTAYKHSSRDMLVVKRTEQRWDAYSLSYGSAVEGVFVTAAEAMEWCEGRAS